MKQLILIASILLVSNFRLSGQSNLEEVLAQFPARSGAELTLLVQHLADLGTPGVISLSERLVPPRSSTNDLKERYALSGLAKYIGERPGTDEYQAIEEGFLQALELNLDVEVEVFLIDQLQFFGSSKSVDVLQSKIGLLCEPAVQALTQVGSDEALDAIIAAAKTAQGYCLEVITKAITAFESPKAVNHLIGLLRNSNEGELRSQALQGLAKSSSMAAFEPLFLNAQTNPNPGNDLLLSYIGNQAKAGKKEHLQSVFTHVMAGGTMRQQEVAIKLAAKYMESGAQKLLVKTMKKGPTQLAHQLCQTLATDAALKLEPYFKYIKKVENPSKIALLAAARIRNYKAALPIAKSYLKSEDTMLQLAALETVSELNGRGSLSEIQNIVVSTPNERLLDRATEEFSRWIDQENLGVLENALKQSTGRNKAAIIDLIAERRMASMWPQIELNLESTNAQVRMSAFASIPQLTGEASITDLIALVSIAKDAKEMSFIEEAFQIKASEANDKNNILDPLITAFGNSNPNLLGRIFPAIGGNKALEFILAHEQNSLFDWKWPQAIPHLFNLIDNQNGNPDARKAILRLCNHPQLSAEQKLLHLRKLMPLTSSIEDKSRIISAMGDTKLHTAFMYVKGFLGEEELKLNAAKTMVRLALPASGETTGLTGPDIREGLLMADSILTGTEDAYTKAFLHNYLESMPNEDGFVSLFNGKNLEGWQGLVENPIARDTMFRSDLRIKQQEADAKLPDSWKIEDGRIVFFGEGYQNLCSVKSYRDFELLVDWKIAKDGDSGIYLRGTPQVQIWDTSRVQDGAQVGSGGLYNNQVYEKNPLQVADNAVGEWNTFRIIMIQDKVTVYLNGVLVTDNTVLENYWNRELPIFREGPIELQAHGTGVEFRDVYVKELMGAPDLPEIEQNMGFVQLFNGINLDGWIGNKTDYVVENGEIVIYPGSGGGSGNLYTEEEYADFTFSFEFKLTPGANNGLGIHAPLGGDAAYEGKEIQILDNSSPIYADLKDYQYHGSVYGILPAEKGALKPVGEWNREEVSVKGNQIRVVLNGQRILAGNLDSVTRNGTLDGKEHPGLQKLKGHIGFLGHGSQVHFRNIRIKVDKEEAE
ncbi:MAG: DUF1080 domain-containing protein [Saprospiraceae bacterium]|nr:DUF1080 domain-containing protein [Saprospiraceae bacterium]